MARDLNKDEPAFPRDWAHAGHNGMSLRDYFAAKAMAAIIVGNNADVSSLMLGAARDAYAVADYMLKARGE